MKSSNPFLTRLDDLNAWIAKDYGESTCFVLVDEHTREYCLPRLITACPKLQDARIIEILSGEQYKNLQTFSSIIGRLSEGYADRKSLLVNLGGGVTCDMGGFAASCYKRGIDFVHVPTTLLGMIDAAFGGKTGINFEHFKNQIGVFASAQMVVIDVAFLQTLPGNELLSGFAEMVKMALITSEDFWNTLKVVDLTDLETLQTLIIKAIERKQQIVEKDPKEQNLRKILNFGHTFGHAFETFALRNSQRLSHGHAVAMGMICELWLSEKMLNFEPKLRMEISEYLLSKFPKFPISTADFEPLAELLLQDKKNIHSQIKPVLLEKIGQSQYGLNCTKDLCLQAFQAYSTT